MYQGTESLILDHVRRKGNYIHAHVMETEMERQRLQSFWSEEFLDRYDLHDLGSVIIQVRPMYYEDDPVSIKVVSGSGNTFRILRFLDENPEVVRAAIATAMEE